MKVQLPVYCQPQNKASVSTMNKITLILIAVTALAACVSGHGRLRKPAGRATMWRFPEFAHFNPTPNYSDNELFCGGFDVQHNRNGGKCGICGDSYSDPSPRAHEAGGPYGKGYIVATYSAGQVIDVEVQLTASHKGYFEFRLCPHNNPNVAATQECLDQNVLQLADGSGTKYTVLGEGNVMHNLKLRLPNNVRCSQCVFQWHYHTGNRWGDCHDGTSGLGCGPQETFRGCADVAIN